MEKYIGCKIKGFRFDGFPGFIDDMERYIGQIGTIIHIAEKDNCLGVVFKDGNYLNYPLDQLLDHIVNDDPINPDHYKSYSVETIDMMIAIYGKEKVAIHCELTAFKYRQRLGKKDSIEQDMEKEKWYLDKAKELRS